MPHPTPLPTHHPQEAERLGAGPAAKQAEEAEEAIGNSLQTMGEAYIGVKHTQVGGWVGCGMEEGWVWWLSGGERQPLRLHAHAAGAHPSCFVARSKLRDRFATQQCRR